MSLLNKFRNKKIKYIILLDLDGVLNISGIEDQRKLQIIRTGANVWRVPTETIEFIKEISNRGDVGIYWLSSWQEESNILNKAIGIKDFPSTNAIYKSNKISMNNIKLDQIKYFKNKFKNTIIISIDDDLIETGADFHISPDSKKGLGNEDFEYINNILK